VAARYDFKAHERTTTLDPDGRIRALAEAALATKSTAVDVAAPASPTAVDVPLSDVSFTERTNEAVVPSRHVLAPASGSTVRGRRRFIAAFGSLGLLVVAVTVLGVRSAGQHPPAASPTPPDWARAGSEVVPPPRPAAPPTKPEPVVPPPVVEPPPEPRTTLKPVESEGARTPASAPHKRRHRGSPAKDTIQYGDDGLPILH
jgi:hypothetical protein